MDAVDNEAVLRIDAVCRMTSLPRPTVYRLITEGRFPPAVKITDRCRGWLLSEVTAWVRSLPRAVENVGEHHG